MEFNPAGDPSATYTYTITPKLVDILSPGPAVTLDAATNAETINIGDLSGVEVWTYPFVIKAYLLSDLTIQASYILKIVIIGTNPYCSTATVSVPNQTDPSPYEYSAMV